MKPLLRLTLLVAALLVVRAVQLMALPPDCAAVCTCLRSPNLVCTAAGAQTNCCGWGFCAGCSGCGGTIC